VIGEAAMLEAVFMRLDNHFPLSFLGQQAAAPDSGSLCAGRGTQIHPIFIPAACTFVQDFGDILGAALRPLNQF
jgi:hypothetical protein